jgi:hypothetical protein
MQQAAATTASSAAGRARGIGARAAVAVLAAVAAVARAKQNLLLPARVRTCWLAGGQKGARPHLGNVGGEWGRSVGWVGVGMRRIEGLDRTVMSKGRPCATCRL